MDPSSQGQVVELDDRWASDALPMELKLNIVEAMTPSELRVHMTTTFFSQLVNGVYPDPVINLYARNMEDWKLLQVARAVCSRTRSGIDRTMAHSATLIVSSANTDSQRISLKRIAEATAPGAAQEAHTLVPRFNHFAASCCILVEGFVGADTMPACQGLLHLVIMVSRDPATHQTTSLELHWHINALGSALDTMFTHSSFEKHPMELLLDTIDRLGQDIRNFFWNPQPRHIDAASLPTCLDQVMSLNAPSIFEKPNEWKVTVQMVRTFHAEGEGTEDAEAADWDMTVWLTPGDLMDKIEGMTKSKEMFGHASTECHARQLFHLGYD